MLSYDCNARMRYHRDVKILRRILSWVLLASVVMALGDAPYVDELFDSLAPHDAKAQDDTRASTSVRSPAPAIDPAPHALRIYEALATIIQSPADITIANAATSRNFFTAAYRSPASTSPRRIDRPPAAPAA